MTSTLYQKQTGSFYTPNSLAQLLAHEVLSAWQQTHPHPLWKNLTILDPACGEGGLLIPFAQELAKLRQIQEPGKSAEVILEDIFQHQLYAADISADALSRYEQQVKKLLKKPVCLHAYGGDSLQEKQGKSVLNSFVPGGADIILANPPYIGQKNHATLFKTLRQNPLWRPYFTAKGDLLYYFFYLALHLLKPRGIGGFITTPYFATSAGGKILRQTLQQNVTFLRLIDFETKQLFKGANLHTLLSVFEKGNFTTPCQVGLPPANITKQDLFYGPASFLQTRFTSSKDLLKRMAKAPFTLGEVATISTGLMTGCDAAFILTEAQKNALPLTSKERAKLKPFFKNSDISPYVPNLHARLWLIDFFYPNDHNLNVKEYPHLLA
ncbi:MAG: N-6 DNA methylase, partial [Elusimicrobiaceae bacterium]|nr:N-6 DNA methylase [Elusimicrobiaceae bacterium]